MARILIAEDEEALRVLIARALTDSGHEVVTFLEHLALQTFRAILIRQSHTGALQRLSAAIPRPSPS